MSQFVVAAFYKFVELADYQSLKKPFYNFCDELGIKGTILLANEGINGTIAGTAESIEKLFTYLRQDDRLSELHYKRSVCEFIPFYRLKVKLKKEIVTMGQKEIKPAEKTGEYVDADEWNNLLNDPDVVVLDTRNKYEYRVGTFKNAIDPQLENFRDFPEYVDNNLSDKKNKKIAMFCTGGIRCEKASAYMLEAGFKKVYQLHGGILQYIEDTPKQDSKWLGDCFVFDNRVTVDHKLAKGEYDQCFACREPISEQDKASSQYKEGVSCPHCYDKQSEKTHARVSERQKQISLAKQRNEKHIGAKMAKNSGL